MSAPLLNIHCCGTQQNPAILKNEIASLRTINQFTNRLILSGVGSDDGVDPDTNEEYPTPGTYDVDAELKRHKRQYWFSDHFNFFHRVAGFAWAAGEDDNIALAMAHIEKKLQRRPSSEKVTINLSGYSRGGASAVHIANQLYLTYGHRIQVNMYLLDPNAGLGRHAYQAKRNIPPNVSRLYVVFNRHETNPLVQSGSLPHYLLSNPQTAVSSIYLDGNHYDPEYVQPPNQRYSKDPAPAELSQSLLELFYESYGATRVNPNRIKRPFIKNEKLHKGYINYKQHQTALDLAIDQLDELPNHQQLPLLLQENEHLTRFEQEIQALNNANYYQLNHYFTSLLSEISRLDLKNDPVKQLATVKLLEATNNLIISMTPSMKYTSKQREEALQQFSSCIRKDRYSETVEILAACIIGLITGIALSLTFAVGGFITGLFHWQSLGLASIPYAAFGAYNGFTAGFEWGKQKILGPQNDKRIEQIMDRIALEESSTPSVQFATP